MKHFALVLVLALTSTSALAGGRWGNFSPLQGVMEKVGKSCSHESEANDDDIYDCGGIKVHVLDVAYPEDRIVEVMLNHAALADLIVRAGYTCDSHKTYCKGTGHGPVAPGYGNRFTLTILSDSSTRFESSYGPLN